MLKLYIPKYEDLSFRQKLIGDPATMSYNEKWGGAIDFPKERWQEWYDWWIVNHEDKRFYRYLQDSETDSFVGEIAYHFDNERKIHLADVIVFSEYRGKGYGNQGLQLLCNAAKEKGIKILYDNIAIDNPAISLFLKNGFSEDYRTDEYIMLKKSL